MRKTKQILLYVIVLFVIETILQVIFYGFAIKYFDKYSGFEKLEEILLDSLYVVGTVKIVFFLPLYLIFYFVFINKNKLSAFKQSIYHSLYFFIIFFILSLVLPGNIAGRISDTIILTLVAFITSFFLARLQILKNVK
ncbi:MAG TPA: hypothetical protein VK498_06075 [Ferruginibacter sp.]|nr:hypothetical protein [Ferruginibacter sp.]